MTRVQTNSTRIREASEWLVTLHNDELSSEQISGWLEWSQDRPENLEAFEQVKRLLGEVKGLDAERKAEALRRLMPARKAAPWKRYALAASVVLTLSAGGYFIQRHHSQTAPFAATFETLKGHDRTVTLPDGTDVKLGARSQLKVTYTATARTVELSDGEAFFDVERETGRPFLVKAGHWRLKDIGTAFNVRKTAEQVVIAVAEGIVDVERAPSQDRAASHQPPAPPLRIVAGEQVVVDSVARPVTVAKVESTTVASWQQGQLRFDDEPLSVVVANLNRYSAREIVLADAKIGQLRFSGTVLTGNVEGWLTAATRVFSLRQESGRGLDKGERVLLYSDVSGR